jgi:hypothetical protein
MSPPGPRPAVHQTAWTTTTSPTARVTDEVEGVGVPRVTKPAELPHNRLAPEEWPSLGPVRNDVPHDGVGIVELPEAAHVSRVPGLDCLTREVDVLLRHLQVAVSRSQRDTDP